MTREEARRYTPTDLWLTNYPPLPPSPSSPTLRLSGLAYLKLLTWRNAAPNEVCCYGLCHPDDALFIVDMILPDQLTQSAYCTPHEDHLLHLMENLLPLGIEPWRWASHWFHTHPRGMGPSPSGTDNNTFNSTRYTACDHSFMAIFGGNDEFSCRLRHRSALPQLPPTILETPTHVHLSYLPPTLNPASWLSLYSALTYTVDPDTTRITYHTTPSTETNTTPSKDLYRTLGDLSEHISHIQTNHPPYRVYFRDSILHAWHFSETPDASPIGEALTYAIANLPPTYVADLTSPQIQALADLLIHRAYEDDVLWAIPNMIEADIRNLATTAYQAPGVARPIPLTEYTNLFLSFHASPSLSTLEEIPSLVSDLSPTKGPIRATPLKDLQ